MRTSVVVCPECPSRHAIRPILERTHGEIDDVRPVEVIRRPAFGHVLANIGILVVKFCQDRPVEGRCVAVPGYCIDVISCITYDRVGIVNVIFLVSTRLPNRAAKGTYLCYRPEPTQWYSNSPSAAPAQHTH